MDTSWFRHLYSFVRYVEERHVEIVSIVFMIGDFEVGFFHVRYASNFLRRPCPFAILLAMGARLVPISSGVGCKRFCALENRLPLSLHPPFPCTIVS